MAITYLLERTSYVQIKGTNSPHKFIAPSGVPQSSHLGPLLVLLFINDLANISEFCNVLFFADDIKLFLEISSDQDCLRMQTVFNKMNWCNANLFFLNFDKCFSISFSKQPNHFKFNYIPENGTPCIRVNSIKDPGVIFDSKLTFKEHITYVVGRAN